MSKDDFASLMEGDPTSGGRAGKRLNNGEVIQGTILQISADSVFVDVGARREARIDRAELADASGKVRVAVGDRVTATVADADADDGPLLVTALGKHGADSAALQAAYDAGLPVDGTISKAVKGGVEVEVGGVRAFCPASHLDVGSVGNLDEFVGANHRFRVLEIKDGGRSIIVSRRAELEAERGNRGRELLETLREGMDVEGTVTTVQKYGAFVDLGGLEGLIHISELTSGRVDRVEDVVSAGDRVGVRVLGIEPSDKGARVRLSMRDRATEKKAPAPKPDEVLSAKVTKLAPFGVFVQTKRGEGLVPMRELGLPPGSDHRRHFEVGKEIRVVLARRESSSGKLTFSATKVEDVEERQNYAKFAEGGASTSKEGLGSLGDVFRKKLGLPPAQPEPEPAPPPSVPTAESASEAAQVERDTSPLPAPPANAPRLGKITGPEPVITPASRAAAPGEDTTTSKPKPKPKTQAESKAERFGVVRRRQKS